MDRFLLATNPFRPHQSALCIVHLPDPVAVIFCASGHIIPETGVFQVYQYESPGREPVPWTLSIWSFQPLNRDDSDGRQIKLLYRSWCWFRTYIKSQNLIT